MTLTDKQKQDIEQEAEKNCVCHGECSHKSSYIRGATAYALACIQKDEEIAALKEVLRFADCPELIIENPKFIIGKKPTDEDMEWARGKVKEYIKQEESKDEQIARLRSALQGLIADVKKGPQWTRHQTALTIATEALKQQ